MIGVVGGKLFCHNLSTLDRQRSGRSRQAGGTSRYRSKLVGAKKKARGYERPFPSNTTIGRKRIVCWGAGREGQLMAAQDYLL